MDYNFNTEDIIVASWSNKKQGSWNLNSITGIKVIHLPTKIVVTCDKERSQHRNRHLAFIELENKLMGS